MDGLGLVLLPLGGVGADDLSGRLGEDTDCHEQDETSVCGGVSTKEWVKCVFVYAKYYDKYTNHDDSN